MFEMERVRLDHGSGGEASHELVKALILRRLDNEILHPLDDSAVLDFNPLRLAMTTDSYVVDPIFFPGGDIGSLAVHGTVNDLTMQGARPLYLTLGLILEEGLSVTDLERIVDSVASACREAGVSIVAGDTKVVPKGHLDKIFINTSGVGIIPEGIEVGIHNARPGDMVLINGNIGDHGIAILSQREGLQFKTPILSDSAPLNALVSNVLRLHPQVHALRDPTRGGVATALNEIAHQSSVGILIYEESLPIDPSVRSACEILGLDPLYVANEGKCLLIASKDEAVQILQSIKNDPYGKNARIIGEVLESPPGKALLRTRIGGTRILPMLTGEQLPRIC
jgi:hydrogenase expression/formation protein HypE